MSDKKNIKKDTQPILRVLAHSLMDSGTNFWEVCKVNTRGNRGLLISILLFLLLWRLIETGFVFQFQRSDTQILLSTPKVMPPRISKAEATSFLEPSVQP